MRKDSMPICVHLCSFAACVWLLMVPGVQAVTRAVPGTPIQVPSQSPSAVEPAGIVAPGNIQPASPSVAPPPIKPSGTPLPSGPRLAAPDANDADLERLRKLEAAATVNARKGSPAERTAARASWLLGLLYLHGEHAPVDRSAAKKWFERARNLNEPLANAGLAWCAIDGCGGPPTPPDARPFLVPLKRVNSGLALFLEWKIQDRLAPVHGANDSTSVHANPDAQRMHLLQQAAQAGNVSAINELGLGNVAASRYDLALSQFNAAAGRSPAAASNASLLKVRLEQQAKPQSASGPAEWYAQARRYHRGDGVPSNYAEAIRLYQMAAAGGHQAARRMLELIYSRPAPGGVVNVAWMRQLANMDVTAEGAILSFYTPPTPLLFVRDLTPLYEFIPTDWRVDRAPLAR